MSDFTKLVMADESDLLERVQKHFRDESVLSDGRTPMRVLRSLVSSPRLADYTVRGFNADGFVHVGDSFVDEHTMLADCTQKTYGVELSTWKRIRADLEVITGFGFRDASVTRIQVWPFDPMSLSFDALKIAVAVSYTDVELIREERVVGALNDLLDIYNFEADPKS